MAFHIGLSVFFCENFTSHIIGSNRIFCYYGKLVTVVTPTHHFAFYSVDGSNLPSLHIEHPDCFSPAGYQPAIGRKQEVIFFKPAI